MGMKYLHTNLIAKDWRSLAKFYEDVFGCVRVLPERHLSGESIERGSNVPGARIDGVHLRLPGGGKNGPTLELFQYAVPERVPLPVANRLGFGHIAFQVDDVAAIRAAVVEGGGSMVGTIETVMIEGVGTITWTYVRDPEGNIIELQRQNLKDS